MGTDFTTSIIVNQSPQVVFDSITNVRGWWSNDIKGDSKKLNDEFEFEVKEVHYSKQKLIEVVPNERIVWLVTESNMTFIKNADEWTGTKVVFDIKKLGDTTKLVFTHEGLTPDVECYKACNPAWTAYINHSLKQLIETGAGDPNLEGRQIEKIQTS